MKENSCMAQKHLLPTTVGTLCAQFKNEYRLAGVEDSQVISEIIPAENASISKDCLFSESTIFTMQ